MQIDETRGIMLTLQELLAMLRFVGYSYRVEKKIKTTDMRNYWLKGRLKYKRLTIYQQLCHFDNWHGFAETPFTS